MDGSLAAVYRDVFVVDGAELNFLKVVILTFQCTQALLIP